LWLDASKCSVALSTLLDASLVVDKASPTSIAKSRKNEVELQGLREAHIRDAAALVILVSFCTL
jgi:Xaa-Pro aminopeptidase